MTGSSPLSILCAFTEPCVKAEDVFYCLSLSLSLSLSHFKTPNFQFDLNSIRTHFLIPLSLLWLNSIFFVIFPIKRTDRFRSFQLILSSHRTEASTAIDSLLESVKLLSKRLTSVFPCVDSLSLYLNFFLINFYFLILCLIDLNG